MTAAPPSEPHSEGATLTFTAPQVDALLAFFGGDAGEVTVRCVPEGAIADDPSDPIGDGPSPAGLYAHMTEYPEEGCVWLGKPDPDARPDAKMPYEREMPTALSGESRQAIAAVLNEAKRRHAAALLAATARERDELAREITAARDAARLCATHAGELEATAKQRDASQQAQAFEMRRADVAEDALRQAREALTELVACKDLKDRGWHMRRDGKPADEIAAVEREYSERKFKAWKAARAALDPNADGSALQAALDAARIALKMPK